MPIKLIDFNIFRGRPKNTEMESPQELSHDRRRIVHSIEARLNEKRTLNERLVDYLVYWFGSMSAMLLHLLLFAAWIIFNIGLVPGVKPWDPFPFILLTMIVSLEAIFLSVFVLMSQNRESKIGNLRQEVDLQVNMIAEQEVTKTIRLLAYLLRHLNVPYEKDPELKKMMRPLNTEEIRNELERELGLTNKPK